MIKRIFLFIIMVVIGAKLLYAKTDEVYWIKINGSINPGIVDFIDKGIKKASYDKACCIIIELDTPGGLADSMHSIVKSILSCSIPIVVYVSPSGARAASAGVMITMASDIAAMAQGTNIGAAHPVDTGGQEISKIMNDKVTNDMVANAKSIAEKHGRNSKWVEQAIKESVSITETEALKKNVINIIAKDVNDLIRQINGCKIEGKGILNIDNNPKIIYIKEDLRTRILKIIGEPNIAYILMMVGLVGIYFELSNPGVILPGIIGGISLILSFFAFQSLPVNYAGILLILLAFIFFIAELMVISHGMLSIAGIFSLMLGSLMLFDNNPITTNNPNSMHISLGVFLPTIIMVSACCLFIVWLMIKSQKTKVQTGISGLIGEIGIVKETINLKGKIFIHGELWNAVSIVPIQKGQEVKVVEIDNLLLEVEPIYNKLITN